MNKKMIVFEVAFFALAWLGFLASGFLALCAAVANQVPLIVIVTMAINDFISLVSFASLVGLLAYVQLSMKDAIAQARVEDNNHINSG